MPRSLPLTFLSCVSKSSLRGPRLFTEASEAAVMGIEILGSEDDVIFITNSEPDEGEDQTDHVSETSDEDK